MSRIPVVTIDGPSGVGKGTVARALARRHGWHFLDSGALYRILALAASRRGVALDDGAQVAALAGAIDIRFDAQHHDNERIIVDGTELSRDIRAETTGALASQIATHPAVRAALLDRQRAFRQRPGLVADGRDMGTVVFPDATLKIFLDASAEERARRRLIQLQKAGIEATIAPLFAEIRERDVRDRTRAVSPLKAADDAVTIDTTTLPAADVLSRVEALMIERGCAR